jgi:diketogulonate reductase-like aldo/keto reductase
MADVRGEIILATKNKGADRQKVLEALETSLKNLKTDYVDLLQLHNLKAPLDPNDLDDPYQGLTSVREKGMARFIGMTTHRRDVAIEAASSGL